MQLVEETRKLRFGESQQRWLGVHGKAQAGLEQEEDGGGGPGLRGARNAVSPPSLRTRCNIMSLRLHFGDVLRMAKSRLP